MLNKQPLFSIAFFIPNLRVWEWEVHTLLYFVIFKCSILKQISSMCINLFIILGMWMILSFLFPSNTAYSSLLSSVNSINCCIQFPFIFENNNSFSFLDLLDTKYINQSLVTVFRKSF